MSGIFPVRLVVGNIAVFISGLLLSHASASEPYHPTQTLTPQSCVAQGIVSGSAAHVRPIGLSSEGRCTIRGSIVAVDWGASATDSVFVKLTEMEVRAGKVNPARTWALSGLTKQTLLEWGFRPWTLESGDWIVASVNIGSVSCGDTCNGTLQDLVWNGLPSACSVGMIASNDQARSGCPGERQYDLVRKPSNNSEK